MQYPEVVTERITIGQLTIAKTRRASKEMEFPVESKSCRLTAPSEFLFNKIVMKICQSVNGL